MLKIILKNYGAIITEGLAVVAVLSLLAFMPIQGETGLLNYLSEASDHEDVSVQTVNLSNIEYKGGNISYTNKAITAGIPIQITELFHGSQGINITSIRDSEGIEVLSSDKASVTTGKLLITKKGMYSMTVKSGVDKQSFIIYVGGAV